MTTGASPPAPSVRTTIGQVCSSANSKRRPTTNASFTPRSAPGRFTHCAPGTTAAQSDAETALATIEREAVTHVMLVPAQIVALLAAPGFDPRRLASLQCILSLGAPLLKADKDRESG